MPIETRHPTREAVDRHLSVLGHVCALGAGLVYTTIFTYVQGGNALSSVCAHEVHHGRTAR